MPERVPSGSDPLPIQRPPSPEMKLSPSETIAVVGDSGLATAAGATANPAATIATKTAAVTRRHRFSPRSGRRLPPAVRDR